MKACRSQSAHTNLRSIVDSLKGVDSTLLWTEIQELRLPDPALLLQSKEYRIDAVTQAVACCSDWASLRGHTLQHDDQLVSILLLLEAVGCLEKAFKLFCAWPMARMLAQDLPTSTLNWFNYEFTCGPILRRFLRARCVPANVRSRARLEIASDMLFLKRGLATVSPEFVENELRSHMETLSKEPVAPPPRTVAVALKPGAPVRQVDLDRRIKLACELIVREVFPPGCGASPKPTMPSFNGCNATTRSNGGAFEELHQTGWTNQAFAEPSAKKAKRFPAGEEFDGYRTGELPFTWLGNQTTTVLEPELVRFVTHPFRAARRSMCAGGYGTIVLGYPLEEYRFERRLAYQGSRYDSSPFRIPTQSWEPFKTHEEGEYDAWSTPVDFADSPVRTTREELDELTAPFRTLRVKARTAAVCEPVKVRVISGGDAESYHRCKRFNSVLMRHLGQHPTFRLTGRPSREDDFCLFDKEFLLSGDYKGATDTIDPVWSEFCLLLVAERLGVAADEVPNMLACLTRHTLSYSFGEAKQKTILTVDQKTGQLMGSFMSFPILCILNAAVNWVYLDPTLQTPLRELPLLINGDDVAASSDRDFSDWSEYVARVGFKLSLGKNYIHRDVMTINSEIRIRRSRQFWLYFGLVPTFERVSALNLGLLYGADQSTGNDSLEGRIFGVQVPGCEGGGSLAENCQALLRSLGHGWDPDDAARTSVIDLYVDRNRVLLGAIASRTKRNWFLPRHLGGVGIPLTRRGLDSIGDPARKLAARMLCEPAASDIAPLALESADAKMVMKVMSTDETDLRSALRQSLVWTSAGERSPPVGLSLWDYAALGTADAEPEPAYGAGHALKGCATSLSPVSDATLLRESRWPMRLIWKTRSALARQATCIARHKQEFSVVSAAYARCL